MTVWVVITDDERQQLAAHFVYKSRSQAQQIANDYRARTGTVATVIPVGVVEDTVPPLPVPPVPA